MKLSKKKRNNHVTNHVRDVTRKKKEFLGFPQDCQVWLNKPMKNRAEVVSADVKSDVKCDIPWRPFRPFHHRNFLGIPSGFVDFESVQISRLEEVHVWWTSPLEGWNGDACFSAYQFSSISLLLRVQTILLCHLCTCMVLSWNFLLLWLIFWSKSTSTWRSQDWQEIPSDVNHLSILVAGCADFLLTLREY